MSDTFPNSLWRPRNRPHQGGRPPRTPRTPRTRDSDAITEESEPDSLDRRRITRRRSVSLSVTEMRFSPHLGRDRRAPNRYSQWQAPSLEGDFEKNLFGRTNRQILLFCLGFICPLSTFHFALLSWSQLTIFSLDTRSVSAPSKTTASISKFRRLAQRRPNV
jgi:hypothetical protein